MEGVESELKSFYKNKTIFITGGSGFVGRATIEKLLRVTEVHRIYVLIRPKRDKEIRDRIDAWASDPLFEVLLKSQPNALQKVVPIAGDCQERDLGISLADRKTLTEQVQLVVHSAASVRFVEPLHLALDVNTRATRLMLQLAKEMKHLESFVYVSTAYSNCVSPFITETYYPDLLPCSVDKVLKLREMLDENVFDEMAPALMGKFPNTYTFSKALSEQLIQSESGQLPICVFRPGSIIATDKEPVPGFIDNIYGPMALIYGFANGVLRAVNLDCSVNCNSVPLDSCVNVILCSCWKTAQLAAQSKSDSPPVIYNFVPHKDNNITVSFLLKALYKQRLECPLENPLWYPIGRIFRTPWIYKLALIFYHLLPGYIIDIGLRLQGKKPKLIRIYKKVHKNLDVLLVFMNNNLTIDTKNTNMLWKSLPKADQNLFEFDMEFFDWDNYFQRALLGMRKYLCHEDPTAESLERAKKNMKRLYVMHRLVQVSGVCILIAIGRYLLLLCR